NGDWADLKKHLESGKPSVESLAAEAVAKNENISDTMRRHGLDPVKDRDFRKSLADAMDAARAKGKPEPSDERKRAQERALSNQSKETESPANDPPNPRRTLFGYWSKQQSDSPSVNPEGDEGF